MRPACGDDSTTALGVLLGGGRMVSTGIKGGAPRTANGRIWGVRSAFARSSISRFSEARFFAAISRVSIAAGARPLVAMPGAGKFVESLILIKKMLSCGAQRGNMQVCRGYRWSVTILGMLAGNGGGDRCC